MFKIYFKIAWRNLRKYPGFSLLNVGGLALGIAASFVIITYSLQELNTDKNIPGYDRIYRVATDFFNMGGFAKAQPQLQTRLSEYKNIEAATMFDRGYQETNVEVNHTTYKEPNYFTADSNFFKVFPRKFIEGSAQTALHSPDEIVLTEKLAKKYFGNEAVSGKIIKIGKEQKPYRVSGVVADDDHKSHLVVDFWMPLEPSADQKPNWNSASFYNYIKLRPGSNAKDLERITNDILKRYVYPLSQSSQSFEQWKADPKSIRFFVQPLKDIYLHSNYKFEISPGGNPAQVYVLAIISLFIILIAAVNYVNLTTARASVRAKEVGVKKTLGAEKRSLITQFLVESVCTAVFAMILATILSQLLLILFDQLAGIHFISSSLFTWERLSVLTVSALLLGILAGLYPAFYLTTFSPKKILKADFTTRGNKTFRNSLVIFQFSLAIGLIISTLVVYRQLHFMQTRDKGFDETGVMLINNAGELANHADAFKRDIDSRSEVIATSFAQRTPAGKSIWMYTYQTPVMKESMTLQTFPVDENYIPTLSMHLLQGRNFSKDFPTDSTAAILNEQAVKALELKNPIGAQINQGQKVIGVISDFNFQSLHEKIAPVVLVYSKEGYQLAIRIRGRQNVAGFRSFVENDWKKYSADEPIQYSFLDEDFAALAVKETILSKAIAFFTVLALIIAVIGLFALSLFTIEQKVKEIAIRKLLGSNIGEIVILLSKRFVTLVLISAIIAFPAAWWGMNKWLQGFAYRINIGLWIFVAAALIAVIIAVLTVSSIAIKAATANPVKSLRTE